MRTMLLIRFPTQDVWRQQDFFHAPSKVNAKHLDLLLLAGLNNFRCAGFHPQKIVIRSLISTHREYYVFFPLVLK